jgi:sugar lactone lactonase YvrE
MQSLHHRIATTAPPRSVIWLLASLLLAAVPLAAQFRIATIAGTPYDASGDGGAATLASLSLSPGGLALRDGNLYVNDGARVRRISPNGFVSTIVGLLDPVVHQPIPGFSGDGGPALGAQLRTAASLAFDASGNLYIADLQSSCIRKVTAHITGGVPQPITGSETITTFAGICGVVGNSNGTGAATTATFNAPRALDIDPASGTVYVADQSNNNIRKITAGGSISTIAGTGTPGYNGDNIPATSAQLNLPIGIAVDPATGDVYVADVLNNRLREISAATGTIATKAGNGALSTTGGASVTPDKVKISGSTIFILDSGVGTVRRIVGGNLTTIAGIGTAPYSGSFPPLGDGGPALQASFGSGPSGLQDIVFDASLNFFLSDASSRRIRFVANTSPVTIFGQTVAAGNIATVAGPPGVVTFSGDGGPAVSSRLFTPGGLTLDSANLYISDAGNYRIREVDASRKITTIAGSGPGAYQGVPGAATSSRIQPGNIALGSAGLYLTNNGLRVLKVAGGTIADITNNAGIPSPASPDGTPADQAQTGATSVAFDAPGNLYFGDSLNLRIWKLDATGNVKTIAGGGAVIVDGINIASAPATQARLFGPAYIAFDPGGNLYATDGSRDRILKISSHGLNQPLDGSELVTIFAGTGLLGFSGDGGLATAAKLNGPVGLVSDAAGNIYFTDGVNFRVRKVDTTGTISTVAGTGFGSFSGDGGFATSAQLRGGPLVSDPFGNLYFSDTVNNVVRVLDQTAPVVSGMPGANCSLWPPNHKMVHVATVTASDTGSGVAPGSFTVTGTSNEPPSASQISITANASGGYDISLQADRSGNGNGRIYTLTASVSDIAGHATTATATCSVPHDQGK